MSAHCCRTRRGALPAARRPYSESAGPRLWRPAVAVIALGLGLAGCSTSYQLGALMGGDKAAEAPERTGSVRPAAAVAAPTEADLSYAKSAAVDLMARGSKDASQPWESPRTGARGTVTPLATAYDQGGSTCRDFLVSYVREEKQAWYQGGACRRGSQWVVTEMRPLHRT